MSLEANIRYTDYLQPGPVEGRPFRITEPVQVVYEIRTVGKSEQHIYRLMIPPVNHRVLVEETRRGPVYAIQTSGEIEAIYATGGDKETALKNMRSHVVTTWQMFNKALSDGSAGDPILTATVAALPVEKIPQP